MSEKLRKLFHDINTYPVEKDIRGNIIVRINSEYSKMIIRRYSIAGIVSAIFAALMYFGITYTVGEMAQSGFGQYLTLVFSDGGSVTGYWKEFALLLLESAPVFGLTVIGLAVISFLGSLRLIFRNSHRKLSIA